MSDTTGDPNETAEDKALWARYSALLKEMPGHLSSEMDTVAMELRMMARRETLRSLVIGIYSDGCYPSVYEAISTEGAPSVKIDECPHHHIARTTAWMEQGDEFLPHMPVAPPMLIDGLRDTSRAELEASFGLRDEAERLMASGNAKMRSAMSIQAPEADTPA